MSSISSASESAQLEMPEGVCVLSHEPLNVDKITRSVADDGAGAHVVFIGTTRNSFEGKIVTRLEYQAYTKLAIKTIAVIIRDAHALASSIPLLHVAVHHRLGTVPVGEPSIVIAVSSPRRKEAFVACEYILEEVKAKAQIWKREFYEGEGEDSAEWKANR
ncbi:hypothetical protein PLICRDRAFT_35957 [Plicaturopsis crispa FD-325 SS-3]|nr:hypothetical protein PLICRDRAFT_35957 [Plicaturopsis crispa FD-325 SS-3]